MQPSMNRHPCVSVVMPVFNGEKYLVDAINSILSQTLTDLELVVIDDGSTDESVAIVTSIHDSRIRVVRNERNMGLPFTRNKGINAATGLYIAFLDCDDIAEPTRLEKQVAFLDENPEFGLVGSWAKIIDSDGKLTGQVLRIDYKPEEIPVILLFQNCFVQSAVTMRRSAIPENGYDISIAYAEDYELWTRMAENMRMYNYPEALSRYRVTISSVSHQHVADMLHFRMMVVRRLLSHLGIEASEDELEIHRLVADCNISERSNILKDADSWLQRLLKINELTGRYPQPEFSKVVLGMWLRLCWTLTERSDCVVLRFLTSPLSSHLAIRKRISFAKRMLLSYLRAMRARWVRWMRTRVSH